MSTTSPSSTLTVPAGTLQADAVHSSLGFEVRYMGIAFFKGAVKDFGASLVDGKLAGAARIESLETKDENLHAHLLSPEFFDAERHPEVAFAGELVPTGDGVEVDGEITIKGVTRPAVLRGTLTGPLDRPVRQHALRARAEDDDRPHRVRPQLERRHARRHEGARERRHPEGRAVAGGGGVAMRILGISGSLRRDSHNTALLRAAAEHLPAGVELELWDGLRDVPPYDQDDDVEPAPAAVAALRAAVAGADAVLIATPEYNHSIPGALKNALDWASRPFATNAFRGKPVAVIGASAGLFGAVWAQAELRKVLAAMGARVVEGEVAVGQAAEKFRDGACDEATGQLAARARSSTRRSRSSRSRSRRCPSRRDRDRSSKVTHLSQSRHRHVTLSPVSSVVEGGGCGPALYRVGAAGGRRSRRRPGQAVRTG